MFDYSKLKALGTQPVRKDRLNWSIMGMLIKDKTNNNSNIYDFICKENLWSHFGLELRKYLAQRSYESLSVMKRKLGLFLFSSIDDE